MMRQSSTASAAEPAAPLTPESRSTEFVAVSGGGETSNAEVLLTTAYALMWIATFVFIYLTWKKQNQIAARLGELDQKLRAAQPKA